MTEENCGNCRFKRKGDGGYERPRLYCCKRAPVVVPEPHDAYATFPGVKDTEWCGEWEGKEEEPGAVLVGELCPATGKRHRWDHLDYAEKDVCRDCRGSKVA